MGPGLPNGRPARRQGSLNRWGNHLQQGSRASQQQQQQHHHHQQQQQLQHRVGSSTYTSTDDDDTSTCSSSKPPSQSPSDKNLSEKNLSDKNLSDIKSLLSEMQTEIEALGSSTRSFQESDLKLSNRSSFEQKMKTDSNNFEQNCTALKTDSTKFERKIETGSNKFQQNDVERSQKRTDASVVKGGTSSERRMSNFMITSSVEIEENSNQSFYTSAQDNFRSSTTPDDLPKQAFF